MRTNANKREQTRTNVNKREQTQQTGRGGGDIDKDHRSNGEKILQ